MKTEKTGVFNYPGTVRKINTIQSIRLLNTFRKNPITTMDDLFRNQGDFVELSVGPKKIVICSHPQLAEEVLRQKAPNYRKSRLVFDQIIPLTGRTGLVQMEGELGRTHREYTGPGLNYEAISAAYPLMVQSISGGLEKISAEGIHGKKIDLSTYLTEIILRNALILILGQEDDTERLGKAFLEANRICGARIRGLVPFSAYWPSSKNRELKKCIRSIDEAIFSLIEKRIKNSANQGPDLLSVLIRSNFAKSQIRDHVVTFLFAGYETTASSLVWTLSLLSRNRQVEARIRDECGQIISGGSPTLPDLRKLSYTLNVYQESLRLFPPSWTLAREVTTETQLGGHILKKGTIVLLGVGAFHSDFCY